VDQFSIHFPTAAEPEVSNFALLGLGEAETDNQMWMDSFSPHHTASNHVVPFSADEQGDGGRMTDRIGLLGAAMGGLGVGGDCAGSA